MPKNEQPVAVDLFSGAGGMSLGFESAGFNVAAAFDYNHRCAEAHQTNFPDCQSIQVDLGKASGKELRHLGGLGRRHIDVLFGGPPCGGFSVAGRRNPADPRNELLLKFASFVDQLRPSYFVVENVRGLLIGDAAKKLAAFRRKTEKAGYELVWPVQILTAADYGVPQHRQRIFILGCKSNLPVPSYPKIATPVGHAGRVTVDNAIGDLSGIDLNLKHLVGDVYSGPLGEPSDYAKRLLANPAGTKKRSPKCEEKTRTLTGCLMVKHSKDATSRFEKTTPGTREDVSRFFRLSADGLSPTLRAGTDHIHGKFTAVRPIHYKYPRCITVREAARLHSFPDWFQFHPTKWHGFMQIGNAVPPLLARAVARSVLTALNS